MTQKTILFVCEHGAAKSVIAAAYFNKLAAEKNIAISAIARGTHPDAELSSKTIQGLLEDGVVPTESAPQKLTLADIESVEKIISFCELPAEYQSAKVEQWDNVPPVSADYQLARDAILKNLDQLLNSLI